MLANSTACAFVMRARVRAGVRTTNALDVLASWRFLCHGCAQLGSLCSAYTFTTLSRLLTPIPASAPSLSELDPPSTSVPAFPGSAPILFLSHLPRPPPAALRSALAPARHISSVRASTPSTFRPTSLLWPQLQLRHQA
jgi:hypothetical protein